MKFNWDEFKNEENKIAVHCKTEIEAENFCRKMHKHGMRWCDYESFLKTTEYATYEEETCYSGSGTIGSFTYFIGKGYKILDWSDYIQKEFTKEDLKDGMVVEYNDKELGRRLVVGNYLIGVDGHSYFEEFNESLIDLESDLQIVKVYKTREAMPFSEFMKDFNLELIWERREPKEMTLEEMRKKLEELTGEEIEII